MKRPILRYYLAAYTVAPLGVALAFWLLGINPEHRFSPWWLPWAVAYVVVVFVAFNVGVAAERDGVTRRQGSQRGR